MSEQDNLPVLDVVDLDSALKGLDRKITKLEGLLVGTTIEVLDKMVGISSKDSEIFHLRDNISYRLGALRYHLQIFIWTRQLSEKEIQSDHPLKPMLMGKWQENQNAVFESIVFHSCSMFDYLGNIVDYIAGGRKRRTLQWSGAWNLSRNEESVLSQTKLAPIIERLGSEWINKLYSYRSDIIHFKADGGGVTYETIYPLDGSPKHVITLYAPHRLVRRFAELKKKSKENHITFAFVMFWLAEKTIDSTIEIVEGIKEMAQDG